MRWVRFRPVHRSFGARLAAEAHQRTWTHTWTHTWAHMVTCNGSGAQLATQRVATQTSSVATLAARHKVLGEGMGGAHRTFDDGWIERQMHVAGAGAMPCMDKTVELLLVLQFLLTILICDEPSHLGRAVALLGSVKFTSFKKNPTQGRGMAPKVQANAKANATANAKANAKAKAKSKAANMRRMTKGDLVKKASKYRRLLICRNFEMRVEKRKSNRLGALVSKLKALIGSMWQLVKDFDDSSYKRTNRRRQDELSDDEVSVNWGSCDESGTDAD